MQFVVIFILEIYCFYKAYKPYSGSCALSYTSYYIAMNHNYSHIVYKIHYISFVMSENHIQQYYKILKVDFIVNRWSKQERDLLAHKACQAK